MLVGGRDPSFPKSLLAACTGVKIKGQKSADGHLHKKEVHGLPQDIEDLHRVSWIVYRTGKPFITSTFGWPIPEKAQSCEIVIYVPSLKAAEMASYGELRKDPFHAKLAFWTLPHTCKRSAGFKSLKGPKAKSPRNPHRHDMRGREIEMCASRYCGKLYGANRGLYDVNNPSRVTCSARSTRKPVRTLRRRPALEVRSRRRFADNPHCGSLRASRLITAYMSQAVPSFESGRVLCSTDWARTSLATPGEPRREVSVSVAAMHKNQTYTHERYDLLEEDRHTSPVVELWIVAIVVGMYWRHLVDEAAP
ncbi:hypothetical protein FPV67DRAFT_1447198 [Lyophyllum atratum]|nr:hypothetical protein FPV67DRAFT_1447198 [Lyophyllum atratum]